MNLRRFQIIKDSDKKLAEGGELTLIIKDIYQKFHIKKLSWKNMSITTKNENPTIAANCRGSRIKTSNAVKTGQLLSQAGLITVKDIKHVLAIQQKRKQSLSNESNRLFGIILCDLNLITPVDLYYVLHENNKIYTMEASLACNKKISEKQINILCNEAEHGFYSLFDLILKNEILCISSLQQRIFELYHIPYRHVDRFVYDQHGKQKLVELLDKDIALKNIAIPMIRKNSSLIVGITKPRTLIFIKELNIKLPHYRIISVFIPLPHFKSLYRNLYSISMDKGCSHDRGKDISRRIVPANRQTLNGKSSISFKFKTVLSNPEREDVLISNLYSKYEMLRLLSGEEERPNNLVYFNSFIRESFDKLTTSCCCNKLEIMLIGDQGRVNISARPIDGKKPVDNELIP